MRTQRGFTIIELLAVTTIAAILMSLAAPSFIRTIRSTIVSSNINGFMADLRFARSESMRRGSSVVMCRSDNPEVAAPACATGSGANGWASGWIIFEDLNGSGTKTTSDGKPVLKVQSASSNIGAITEGGSGSTKFRFTSTGRLRNLSSSTQITFGGVDYANELQRVLCVSMAGHTRIAGDGTTTCS